MALFCATIKRDSVSLLRFPFLSHVQVILCMISPVCCLKYPCIYFSSPFFSRFCFVCPYLDIVVTGFCNLAFFFLLKFFFFLCILKSSWIVSSTSMLVSLLPSSFLDIYIRRPLLSQLASKHWQPSPLISILRWPHNNLENSELTGYLHQNDVCLAPSSISTYIIVLSRLCKTP